MKFPVLGGPAESKINVSNRLVWAVLLVISVGWGTSPVAVRIALREGLGPITIASASLMIAAAAVFALMAGLRRGMLIGRVEMRLGGVLAVLSVLVPFQMRNLALENASAGFVSLVSALIPLVTAGMAHFALSDEPLNAPTLASLLLGLGGVFGLISVMSVSAAAVYAKRYAGGYSVLGVTYSTIIGYIVPFIAVFAGIRMLDEQVQPGIAVGGALVLIGVVVTYLIRIRGVRRRPAG